MILNDLIMSLLFTLRTKLHGNGQTLFEKKEVSNILEKCFLAKLYRMLFIWRKFNGLIKINQKVSKNLFLGAEFKICFNHHPIIMHWLKHGETSTLP